MSRNSFLVLRPPSLGTSVSSAPRGHVAALVPAERIGGDNHRPRHPVLHAARGVLPLELHEDVRAPWWNDLAESDNRGVADGFEDVHASGSPAAGDATARGATA